MRGNKKSPVPMDFPEFPDRDERFVESDRDAIPDVDPFDFDQGKDMPIGSISRRRHSFQTRTSLASRTTDAILRNQTGQESESRNLESSRQSYSFSCHPIRDMN